MRSKSRVKNRIRELRFQRGEMTQEELARQIGVSRQTIIAIEQGRYCPSLESALRMAKVFGMSVDQVFSLDEAHDNAGGV